MFSVGGVSGVSGEHSMVAAIRSRLPWLTINLATTLLEAATVNIFESTLAKFVILAAFLPVVAGQGGFGGTQTLTMIARSMALGEFVGVSAVRLLTREAFLGLPHGLWLGVSDYEARWIHRLQPAGGPVRRRGFREYRAGQKNSGKWRLTELSDPFQPLPKGEPEMLHLVWVYRVNS